MLARRRWIRASRLFSIVPLLLLPASAADMDFRPLNSFTGASRADGKGKSFTA